MTPFDCPVVPIEILYPKNTWNNPDAYNNQLKDLAKRFVKNFDKFRNDCEPSTLAGEPKIL